MYCEPVCVGAGGWRRTPRSPYRLAPPPASSALPSLPLAPVPGAAPSTPQPALQDHPWLQEKADLEPDSRFEPQFLLAGWLVSYFIALCLSFPSSKKDRRIPSPSGLL